MIQHWPDGVDVLFNPANDRLPQGQMEAGLQYACWSIKERTGIDIRYAGQTTKRRLEGKIIVFIAMPSDYADPEINIPDYFYNRGFMSPAHLPGQPYESVRIGVGRHWHMGDLSRRNQCTNVHELLHACGASHIVHDSAVMRASFNEMYPGSYGLQCADYMPLDRGGSHSHVELTMENDIFIPNIHGHVADLEYVGDGSTHRWKLRRLSLAGEGAVESAATVTDLRKPDIVLTDVRSPTMRLTRVELRHEPETETWLLVHAE